MRVLVTGGCGYKGSVLIPKLKDHEVTILDTCWFGVNQELPLKPRLVVADIREATDLSSFDAVIHLAGIANDPCGELDSKLTWEVNVLGTMRLAELASRGGVKQFIFASSASVYGIKGEEEITEDLPLEPVSDYNKTKMVAERVLLSYQHKMAIQIVRPATVCGMSPRMRLDTMVNMLTMQALTEKKITAHCGEHGGKLMRPNIHIQDVTDLYLWMLEHPQITGVFNAGFENLSAMETAEMICKKIPSEINITTVKDKRSYRINSDKLLSTGFTPRYSVADAIDEIKVNYDVMSFRPEDKNMNLKWMKLQGLVA